MTATADRLLLAAGGVAHHAVVHGLPKLERRSTIIDVASTAVVCALALRRGMTWSDLVAPAPSRDGGPLRGVGIGALAATPALIAIAIAAGTSAAPVLADRRTAREGSFTAPVEIGELRRMLTIGVPVGVVLPEELLFRGLLYDPREPQTNIASSVAFGLWHAAPNWRAARRNGFTGRAALAVTMLSMVGSGVVGLIFCEIRARGGLVAPAVTHVLVNMVALGASWRALTAEASR